MVTSKGPRGAAVLFCALVVFPSTTMPAPTKKPNHLVHEKSPYLLQHAYNPVDWYPWGDEALDRARKEHKPIFLSIGYSTCHWCHVMEHESFEDPETAALMNRYFVNIKVDREERPDLDSLYMTAVQLLTGSGGWPMSVWLTPDLKPFYAGTYFPPEDRYGRPGFKTVLEQLAEFWAKQNDHVLQSSHEITQMIEQTAKHHDKGTLPSSASASDACFKSLKAMFDQQDGGFGNAPKFPMPVYLEFLLAFHRRTDQPAALEMASFTVTKMAQGGIYDQLGGGFSRYSTDARWVVPHFEKMLYDNAQLLAVAALLYRTTGDKTFETLVRETATYVLRDLTHPEGAFFSAEDADSEGKEGTFYLWTLSEINRELGDDAAIFAYRFGVTVNGNFMDPHTREAGKNILVQAHTPAETAKHFAASEADVAQRLERAKKKLFDVRSRRIRPHRDDKVITEWNGLMISALAHASTALHDPSYLAAAEKAARFLEKKPLGQQEGRALSALEGWRKEDSRHPRRLCRRCSRSSRFVRNDRRSALASMGYRTSRKAKSAFLRFRGRRVFHEPFQPGPSRSIKRRRRRRDPVWKLNGGSQRLAARSSDRPRCIYGRRPKNAGVLLQGPGRAPHIHDQNASGS